MKTILALAVLTLSLCACPAAEPAASPAGTHQELCAHGVQKDICPRCNPALKAAYVAKGDWCAEHERPESQCVVCHPELAKRGIK